MVIIEEDSGMGPPGLLLFWSCGCIRVGYVRPFKPQVVRGLCAVLRVVGTAIVGRQCTCGHVLSGPRGGFVPWRDKCGPRASHTCCSLVHSPGGHQAPALPGHQMTRVKLCIPEPRLQGCTKLPPLLLPAM